MKAFDWPALMRIAIQELQMQPDRFWALTPVEFTMIVSRGNGLAPLSRTGLDALLNAYPDATKGDLDD
ncbi:rcc01693 family protein [Shimia sp.]|uniref:rcc01693 family protein n=1 Tax=Shimia sp. TaxID=1954381 RepID=UPI003296C363